MEEIKTPRGLFAKIIKRLGLEKQLQIVRRHLGLFTSGLVFFILLSILAFIGLKHVLAESSFGPYISLVISDPWMVLQNWHSFSFSVFESIPGANLVMLLFALAILLMFVRLANTYLNKFLSITKNINKQKQYGHK